MNAIVPIPRVEISIRPATLADIPFMDGLQKKYGRALGYFPTKQFEGYVNSGGVLIAEEVAGCELRVASEDKPATSNKQLATSVGYIISRDRYLKRDEHGVIYQLCVSPGVQRKLVGAALVREVFARSAYGCRLYCCWCAQDLEANRFWESMGFMPIAFRTGSDKKRRIHIFWQRRIVEGDATTPIWYPSQTNSGAIREDRLVFPIPPGVHWKEVQAVVLPKVSAESQCQLPTPKRRAGRATHRENKTLISRGGLRPPEAAVLALPLAKPKRVPKTKAKHDPKHVAAARELRDRYLERFNGERFNGGLVLPHGKYDVCRVIEDGTRLRQTLRLAS